MSNLGIGQMNQLADSFEAIGYSEDEITKLRSLLSEIKYVLNGQAEIVRRTPIWREEDGVIYFTLLTDGTTGAKWIKRLKRQGYRPDEYAKQVLKSKRFQPTTGVVYDIAVLKGGALFSDDERTTENILAEGERRGYKQGSPEIACLIRETFTDKELVAMGLRWIVVMHEAIDVDGVPSLLGARRSNDVGSRLITTHGNPDLTWSVDSGGFAFVAPQVSSKN